MTSLPPASLPARQRRPVPRRSPVRLVLGIVLRVALLVAVFAVGVALGEALHDNPRPGDTRTQTRQLRPIPLPPVTRTVTVTTRR